MIKFKNQKNESRKSKQLQKIYIYIIPYLIQQKKAQKKSKMRQEHHRPLLPRQRAQKLGLKSNRFYQDEMSQNALQQINNAKIKDRSGIKLNDWYKNKFYQQNIIEQLFICSNNITRIHVNNVSVQQFIQYYQKKNLPIVIQGCTQNWNVNKYWTFQHFYRQYKQSKFKIGQDDDGYKIRIALKYYLQYLIYNIDDSPLYMFQSSLQDNQYTDLITKHYQIPVYFRNDILKYADEKRRPPYRWLLMGPERSGSTVHIDPLNTSAWNTSLQGFKRWILFPENVPKFVVKGRAYRGKEYVDESINYFTEIIPKILSQQNHKQLGVIQFIQKPGETVFIPGGWWHAVLNLSDTIAITQNIMTQINFEIVWRSIRSERRKFAKRFIKNLQDNEYKLYQRAIDINRKDQYQMGNKYQKQSISLSFTETQSSSSESSDLTESDEEECNGGRYEKQRRRKSEDRNGSYSRSRDKLKQKKNESTNDKKRKQST